MTPAIEQAIAEIRVTFEGHPIDVDPDPEGGAFVTVHDLSLGDQYEPSVSWVAFRITFQYPHADVYPHFCVGGLKRKDGTELGDPFHKATWETPRGAEASISRVPPRQPLECRRRYRGHQTHPSVGVYSHQMNTFRIAEPLFRQLTSHLFPGDGDEHGAVIAAGVERSTRGTRFLARELFLAKDGVDYVPGRTGYRALTADFVARVSDHCSREGLAYFAVHCHGGTDTVSFSPTDLQSHKRGYPALLDITKGGPVGALVFAQNAVAGEVWTPGAVDELHDLTVVGLNHRRLFPSPRRRWSRVDARYDRQALPRLQ